MPVDVFGRTTATTASNGDVIFRGINMSQANVTFLRRDGENAAEGNISLNSHKLVDVADPTNDKDAANKEYVDTNAGTNIGIHKVDKSGDVCMVT